MATNLDDITAIRTRFLSAWGSTTPIVIANDPSPVQPDVAYIVFHVMPNVEERLATGAAADFEVQGIIWADIYSPSGEGDGAAWNLAEKFATAFRDWRSTDGRINCGNPSYRQGEDEDKFMRLIVNVPYRAWHQN